MRLIDIAFFMTLALLIQNSFIIYLNLILMFENPFKFYMNEFQMDFQYELLVAWTKAESNFNAL